LSLAHERDWLLALDGQDGLFLFNRAGAIQAQRPLSRAGGGGLLRGGRQRLRGRADGLSTYSSFPGMVGARQRTLYRILLFLCEC
jgi:hypothetical protein